MKLLFLTDNFPPEVNAPATRTHFHCVEWVRAGVDVTVITGAPNFPRGEVYPGYRNAPWSEEWVDGVRVVRVGTYIAANEGFVKRTLDYMSYAAAATVAALREDFDVVVATSPQFFTAVAGRVVGLLKRRPWVFELRDMWPESIVATGAMGADSPAIRMLERLEMDLYRTADLIVPVTEAFARRLHARGIPGEKMVVVTNGVDRSEFREVVDAGRVRFDESRPFRVGYVGTIGLAHGLDLVPRAARLMRGDPVEFVVVGDGADRENLARTVAEAGLANVRLVQPVPREQIPDTLGGLDAALVPLKDREAFRHVIPSKIFEAAAAGRPILLGVRGESEQLVRQYGAGLPFAPDDEVELVSAVRRMMGSAALRADLTEGCRRLAADFDRRRLAARMLEAVSNLGPG